MTKNAFNMNKIYGVIRKAAVFVPAVDILTMNVPNASKVSIVSRWYFGWDRVAHKFVWTELLKGWGPAIGAQVITRVIPAINKIIRSFI